MSACRGRHLVLWLKCSLCHLQSQWSTWVQVSNLLPFNFPVNVHPGKHQLAAQIVGSLTVHGGKPNLSCFKHLGSETVIGSSFFLSNTWINILSVNVVDCAVAQQIKPCLEHQHPISKCQFLFFWQLSLPFSFLLMYVGKQWPKNLHPCYLNRRPRQEFQGLTLDQSRSAVAVIWGVNERMEELCLFPSLSLFQRSKMNLKHF